MYLAFTLMSGESYLRSSLLCLCDVFRALFNYLRTRPRSVSQGDTLVCLTQPAGRQISLSYTDYWATDQFVLHRLPGDKIVCLTKVTGRQISLSYTACRATK